MSIILKIKKTDDAKDLPLPAYMSEGAAGMDLYANVKEEVIL
ncbi:MAG TPA: dUTP diphosphatase, partial [Thermoanaerobacter sp.]|nr:dUTP diphosphatase [Thermoanaerobacter sp.]